MHATIANDQRTMLDHYYVRGTVFIEEQNIPWHLEFDEDDYRAILFNLYDGERPIAAARLVDNKVGRVAVLKSHRRRKAGTYIMEALETHARENGMDTLKLGAQTYIVPFYEAIGYTPYGEVYLDAGIEHRMMKKKL